MPMSSPLPPSIDPRAFEARLRDVADHLPDDPARALAVLATSMVMVANATATDPAEVRDIIIQAFDEAFQSRDGGVTTSGPSPRDAGALRYGSGAASPEEPSPDTVQAYEAAKAELVAARTELDAAGADFDRLEDKVEESGLCYYRSQHPIVDEARYARRRLRHAERSHALAWSRFQLLQADELEAIADAARALRIPSGRCAWRS